VVAEGVIVRTARPNPEIPPLHLFYGREAFLKKHAGASAQLGGKGTMRRKFKVAHKPSTAADDKKVQTALRRLGSNPVGGIEEVAMVKESGEAMVFKAPKVQAAIAANTFIISGGHSTVDAAELSAEVLQQIGPEAIKALGIKAGGGGKAASGAPAEVTGAEGVASFDDMD
jgi:nascent polypeptide-associated complex subunit beta